MNSVDSSSENRTASASRCLSGTVRHAFRRHQPPGVKQVRRQFVITDLLQFDADPPPDSDIRGPEELSGRGMDEYFLMPWRCWDPDRDVSIVVVVVREHGEDPLVDEERGFSVREFLGGSGEGRTQSPYPLDVFLAGLPVFRRHQETQYSSPDNSRTSFLRAPYSSDAAL